jgi:hypothetical protein
MDRQFLNELAALNLEDRRLIIDLLRALRRLAEQVPERPTGEQPPDHREGR